MRLPLRLYKFLLPGSTCEYILCACSWADRRGQRDNEKFSMSQRSNDRARGEPGDEANTA